jgi:hypothetical protein
MIGNTSIKSQRQHTDASQPFSDVFTYESIQRRQNRQEPAGQSQSTYGQSRRAVGAPTKIKPRPRHPSICIAAGPPAPPPAAAPPPPSSSAPTRCSSSTHCSSSAKARRFPSSVASWRRCSDCSASMRRCSPSIAACVVARGGCSAMRLRMTWGGRGGVEMDAGCVGFRFALCCDLDHKTHSPEQITHGNAPRTPRCAAARHAPPAARPSSRQCPPAPGAVMGLVVGVGVKGLCGGADESLRPQRFAHFTPNRIHACTRRSRTSRRRRLPQPPARAPA